MGVSQNGCLGPKKREMEIYMELIDTIHNAAEKMQIKEGSDIYLSLQSQLIKTGYIRKLADHLSSHRSKLAQSFHHNLKIVTQKRNINNRFAALIVVDSIYESINKEKKNQENLVTEQETLAKTSTNNSSTLKLIKSYSQENSGTGAVIQAKLEGYYFKFILYLLEYEEKMYGNLLESIDSFCNGRKQKLNCKMEISRILDIIMRHLKEDIKIDESSHTYLSLLENLKENTKQEYINEKDIMIFLKLWLKDQEKITKDSIIEMEISRYELILRKIISRCVSSWDLTILLFHSMFVFFDQDRFSGYKVMKIEELYMRTILQHDLHSQILRSLFLYLLNYLSESSMNDRSYILKPKYQENSSPRYSNISEKSCKINGFATLRRWAERQYINLDEIVTYSCLALVKAFTFNMKSNSQCLKQICDQFIKITGLVNTKSKFIIINVLLEEIRLTQTDQQLRKILIGLVQQILVNYSLLQHLLPDFMNFFTPLDHQFTLDSKVLIIKLLSYIVKHVGLHQLITNGQSSHLSVSICEFMHSLFEGLQINEFLQTQDIIYQLKYMQSCVQFLQSFVQNMVLVFAFIFLEQLSSKIAIQLRNSTGFSTISIYFQLFLFYQGIKILGKEKFICPSMQKISSKIKNESIFPDLKTEIDQLITELIQNTHGSVQKFITFHKEQLHHLKGQLQMKQNQYDEIAAIFNIHFKSQTRQEQISRRSLHIDTKSHFRRPSVNNSYYDSFEEKSKFEMDDSFRNILNNLHDN